MGEARQFLGMQVPWVVSRAHHDKALAGSHLVSDLCTHDGNLQQPRADRHRPAAACAGALLAQSALGSLGVNQCVSPLLVDLGRAPHGKLGTESRAGYYKWSDVGVKTLPFKKELRFSQQRPNHQEHRSAWGTA